MFEVSSEIPHTNAIQSFVLSRLPDSASGKTTASSAGAQPTGKVSPTTAHCGKVSFSGEDLCLLFLFICC